MPWLTLAAFNIYVGDGILMIVSWPFERKDADNHTV